MRKRKFQNLRVELLVIVLAGSLGCSVVPQKKGDSLSDTKATDSKLQAKALTYRRSIASLPEDRFKVDSCQSFALSMKLNWDWKQAVVAGNSCMRNRDLTRAEEIGNELSIREPSAPWGPYFLASVARDRLEFERALWMSELAMKRGSEIGLIHYLKGQILWAKKEYSASVYSFEKSTELDPSLIAAHLFLGRLYFRDQTYGKASRHFYAVLKIDPKHRVALAGLAESQLHDKNSQGALESYQRLAEAYPSNGFYLGRMAEIYEQNLNEGAKALASYKLLQAGIRSGAIQLNIDPDLDSKIKELELMNRKSRALASTEKSGSQIR